MNSRVGTLIPPRSPVSGVTAGTTIAFDPNATSFDTTQAYTSSWQSTVSLLTSTAKPSTGSRYLSENPDEARIMVAAALALVGGVVHIAMAILHFGYVSVYLSDSIIQGFTTGCAIHIITSQVPTLIGIKIKTTEGQSKVIKVGNDNTTRRSPIDLP